VCATREPAATVLMSTDSSGGGPTDARLVVQALGYYVGMLCYYWVLATPAVGWLFGCYLYICVNWFGVHYDEVHCSVRPIHQITIGCMTLQCSCRTCFTAESHLQNGQGTSLNCCRRSHRCASRTTRVSAAFTSTKRYASASIPKHCVQAAQLTFSDAQCCRLKCSDYTDAG
jgi:hypothetical protein